MIELFVIGYGRPDLLVEQKRLLDKNLGDPFSLTVLDNTPPGRGLPNLQQAATTLGLGYLTVPSDKHEHPDGLNLAAGIAHREGFPFWGTLDHDIMPRTPATLIDRIVPAGFFGIGQRHYPTGLRYLFPGFAFWSRDWLKGRVPDYNGIRAVDKRDDGDCGSMLASLFREEDWERMPQTEHGYGYLRPDDGHGLQSWGYEVLDGSWLHLTNGSSWKAIPNRGERERLIREMLAAL